MNIGFAMSPALGVKLGATSSNQRVTLDTVTLGTGNAGQTVAVYNAGSVVCFVAFGDSTITATVQGSTVAPNCAMIPPSGYVSFTRGPGVTTMGYITESSTANLYVNIGTGQ